MTPLLAVEVPERQRSDISLPRRIPSLTKASSDRESKRLVGWSDLKIYYYPPAIGHNPAVSSGVPITLGAEPNKVRCFKIDYYERKRRPRRGPRGLCINKEMREEILLEEGFKKADIIATIRAMRKIRHERKQTIDSRNISETVTKTASKLKRIVWIGGDSKRPGASENSPPKLPARRKSYSGEFHLESEGIVMPHTEHPGSVWDADRTETLPQQPSRSSAKPIADPRIACISSPQVPKGDTSPIRKQRRASVDDSKGKRKSAADNAFLDVAVESALQMEAQAAGVSLASLSQHSRSDKCTSSTRSHFRMMPVLSKKTLVHTANTTVNSCLSDLNPQDSSSKDASNEDANDIVSDCNDNMLLDNHMNAIKNGDTQSGTSGTTHVGPAMPLRMPHRHNSPKLESWPEKLKIHIPNISIPSSKAKTIVAGHL